MLSTLQRTFATKNVRTEILSTLQQHFPPPVQQQPQHHQHHITVQPPPHQHQQRRTFAKRTNRRRKPPPSRLTSQGHDGSDTLVNSASMVNESESSSGTNVQVQELIDSSSTFVARDKDGNEVPMDEYLKFASLSPWVPCPDPVARKMLDITQIGPNDVHYELGSGDGRINFHALDPPYMVKKSVGIDIDPNLVQTSNERIARRHPRPENIQFICADLLDTSSSSATSDIWNTLKDECTVLTMYFVEDALLRLKPTLERHLAGSPCKIVTVGYGMQGWEPDWEEVCLGLKIHLYDMERFVESPLSSSSSFAGAGLPPQEELPEEYLGGVLGGDRSEALEEDENSPFVKDAPPEEPEEDPNADIPFHWDDFDEVVEEVEEGDTDGKAEVVGEGNKDS